MGGYDETPEEFGEAIRQYAMDGIVNMVGGCCGTTPAFIKELAKVVAGVPRRIVPEDTHLPMFSGLTEYIIHPNINFVNVGERCNISGSIQFKKLIVKGDFEAAAKVAKDQVENGA